MANINTCSSLAARLRGLICKSGLFQHQIARDTGIRQPGLSRFLSGGSIRIETIDALL